MGALLTSTTLALMAGMVISILADLVPGWTGWYASRTPIAKRWVMIAVLGITSVVIVSLSCWEPTQLLIAKYVVVECSEAGIIQVVEVFVYALVGNQGMFLLSPTTGKRKGGSP